MGGRGWGIVPVEELPLRGAMLTWAISFRLQVTKMLGIFFLEKRTRTCDCSAFGRRGCSSCLDSGSLMPLLLLTVLE